MRIERAGESGEHRRDDKRRDAIARQMHAEHAGGDFILAHRFHGPADARSADENECDQRKDKRTEDDPVAGLLRNAG